MESINEIEFDLVIAGTGLPQSLLALALSRSGKKILHVDRNGYYGGAEAALSLQEAEEWVDFIKNGSSEFRDANIYQPNRPDISASSTDYAKLGFSRAYSLALSPQLIYSRSALLPTLVSSKVYRQLEFLAVGAWWIYEQNEGVSRVEASTRGRLHRIPGGREDVFADKTIDLKAKRSLMRFLKFVSNVDAQAEALEFWGSRSFADFLLEQYDIPLRLQATLHALTLSPHPPDKTKTSYALPRITRHLASIGIFGSGFGSVIPKWGGLAEVCQVACRAGAVGGGIYMLGRSIEATTEPTSDGDNAQGLMTITLPSNEVVRSHRITGRQNDLPSQIHQRPEKPDSYVAHSVTIVSSTIREIFPPIADGAPPPACTVIVFPVGSLQDENDSLDVPIYLMVHSSDTGECPANRSIIYSSISLAGDVGKAWLRKAVHALLNALTEEINVEILWELSFDQLSSSSTNVDPPSVASTTEGTEMISLFPPPSTDLAFDDGVLRQVRSAWQSVTGNMNGFMQFEDREVGAYEDEDE